MAVIRDLLFSCFLKSLCKKLRVKLVFILNLCFPVVLHSQSSVSREIRVVLALTVTLFRELLA